MDAQFENQYIISEQVYDEYFAYFYFKKPAAIAGIIVSLVALAAAIWVCFLLGRVGILPIIAFILIALFFILQIAGYFRARKLYYRLDLEDNGGRPVEIRVLATPECLLSFRVPDGEENRMEYGEIKQRIETRNLLILLAPKARPFVFDKNHFTKGSFDEFKAFLEAKTVKKRP